MKIEIYEPQQLVMPGVTEVRKRLKRTIEIIDVKREANKYIIALDDAEIFKAIEFTNSNKSSGMSEFTIHIKSIDKWISSTIIEADKGTLFFSVFRENFMLSNTNCQEV